MTLKCHDFKIKRFRNSIRWKWFWLEKARKEKEDSSLSMTGDSDNSEMEESTMRLEVNKGLGTGLRKPSTANTAPVACLEVEAFLEDVTRTILGDLNAAEVLPKMNKVKEICELEKRLSENNSMVIVPTDKMNSFRVVKRRSTLTGFRNT